MLLTSRTWSPLQALNDQVQVSYNLRDTEIDVMAVLLGQKAGWFGVGVLHTCHGNLISALRHHSRTSCFLVQTLIRFSVRPSGVCAFNALQSYQITGFGDKPGEMVDSDVVIGQVGNMLAEPFRILAYSFYGIAPVPVCGGWPPGLGIYSVSREWSSRQCWVAFSGGRTRNGRMFFTCMVFQLPLPTLGNSGQLGVANGLLLR